MATETTKTEKTEETATAPETEREKVTGVGSTGPEATDTEDAAVAKDAVEAEDDSPHVEDDDPGVDAVEPATAVRGGFGAGAAAVVSAGLGLCSLTGTSLSEMLRERKQMIGQIEASSQPPTGGGGGADQITALYGAPWHASALFNGVFALLAVVVGGILLALVSKRADTGSWVKAVALGGLILGIIGLVVAGGMYLDLFASQPEVPGQPS
ncbi:hypothetical protein ACFPA8_07150 [Streptomyces ovatisporus]|uniref:Integral membrane protein n=1 Tax=Streptomyces ovatisporus TaxID=1128682 RepID=A0ABV9A4R5_9ACTN